MQRPWNVLDGALAHIVERIGKLVLDLVADDARHTNPAGFGQFFKTRGHVHTVAEDVVVLDNHVAEIEAHAEFELPLVG